jgi:protein arginine N-methyltransferase 7
MSWKTSLFFWQVSLIFGEPNFSLSLLPWHNLLFWYNLQSVLKQVGSQSAVILPRKAELWAVPVHFADLWKIRCPLHFVEGFQMEHFDNIIMVSMSSTSQQPNNI